MNDITHNPQVYAGATAAPETFSIGRLELPPPDIIFHNGTPNELRITAKGITYRGQELEDAGAVHQALLEVMNGRPLAPLPDLELARLVLANAPPDVLRAAARAAYRAAYKETPADCRNYLMKTADAWPKSCRRCGLAKVCPAGVEGPV